MPKEKQSLRQGIYNVDYFSGAQCALYIGDTWVDEVTSMTYSVRQNRMPLYGYADQLFKDVSKGQVLVQGEFTINFKEAGYLFLILDRYQTLMNNRPSLMHTYSRPGIAHRSGQGKNGTPFAASDLDQRESIESLINNDEEFTNIERNRILQALAAGKEIEVKGDLAGSRQREAAASLGGFSSQTRASGGIGAAENIFEAFEDIIWKKPKELDNLHRRADDPRLNPFDIYMAFGDFAGDNNANHTIQKLSGVHIIGSVKQVVIDGQPIQEAYSFIARNLI
jgi:hypothetical protein